MIIYRKEKNCKSGSSTDTTIHYTSNHPIEQKMAAFRYYINRLLSLPLAQERKNKELAEILNMAKINGFPEDKIIKLKTQLTAKAKKTEQPTSPQKIGNLHTL